MLICEAVEPDGKSCRACGVYKSLDCYSKGSSGKYGLQNLCKPCSVAAVVAHARAHPERRKATARKSFLKTAYGTSPEEVEAMWAKQNGQCASCSDPLRKGTGGAAVDHIHGTKIVRAILCAPCNVTIGQMQEDPTRLRQLADYLEAHRAKIS